jgi:hypothetical protein
VNDWGFDGGLAVVDDSGAEDRGGKKAQVCDQESKHAEAVMVSP